MVNRLILFVFFSVISFSAFALDQEKLLKRYKSLHPYHETIKDPMPVRACKKDIMGKESCALEIHLEDNPDKMEMILRLTEKHFNTKDNNFLNSNLGRQYRALKNFLSVHEDFGSCKEDLPLFTGSAITDELERSLANLSLSIAEDEVSECYASYVDGPLSSETLALVKDCLDVIYGAKKQEFPREAIVEDKLFLEGLMRSIQTIIKMEQILSGKRMDDAEESILLNRLCASDGVDYKGCNDSAKSILRKVLRRELSRQEAKPLVKSERPTIFINGKIDELNTILGQYNSVYDKAIKAIGSKKLSHEKKLGLEAQLLEIKKIIFEQYHQHIKFISGGDDAGILMQTEAIRKKTGIEELSGVKAKFFGLGGFEMKNLSSNAKFPLLKKVDAVDISKAVVEFKKRTSTQVTDLIAGHQKKSGDDEKYVKNLSEASRDKTLDPNTVKQAYIKRRMEEIERITTLAPAVVGHTLLNNPDYSDVFCNVSKNIHKNRRNRKIRNVSGYIIIGGVIFVTVGAAATAVGVPVMAASLTGALANIPLTAIVVGIGEAAAIAALDYQYSKHDYHYHRLAREAVLGSYLSGVGDKQSIEDIRAEWKEALKAESMTNIVGERATTDFTRLTVGGRVLGLASRLSGIGALASTVSGGGRVSFIVLKDNAVMGAIGSEINGQMSEQIGDLLLSVTHLPIQTQEKVLKDTLKFFNKGEERVCLNNRSGTNGTLSKNADKIINNEKYHSFFKKVSYGQMKAVVNHIDKLERSGEQIEQIVTSFDNILSKCE